MEGMTSLGMQEAAYEPPQTVMDAVLLLARSEARLKQLSNVLTAMLTFDSFRETVPAGVRLDESTSRHMTYEGGEIEIQLWLRRSEDQTVILTGQVLTKSGTPIDDQLASVDFVVAGDHIKSSPLSPWGEFVFPDLFVTPCDLQISLRDLLVRIPSLPMIDDK
jgi:hypothetical protein